MMHGMYKGRHGEDRAGLLVGRLDEFGRLEVVVEPVMRVSEEV